MTNKNNTTLYVGVSTDLNTRVWEHKTRVDPFSFTARYNIDILVYYEGFDQIEKAIEREKFIKGKSRKWKDALINKVNPNWNYLSDEILKKYKQCRTRPYAPTDSSRESSSVVRQFAKPIPWMQLFDNEATALNDRPREGILLVIQNRQLHPSVFRSVFLRFILI